MLQIIILLIETNRVAKDHRHAHEYQRFSEAYPGLKRDPTRVVYKKIYSIVIFQK